MRIEQELNCSGVAFPSYPNDESGIDEEGEDDMEEDEPSSAFLEQPEQQAVVAGKVSADSNKSLPSKINIQTTATKEVLSRPAFSQSQQAVQGFEAKEHSEER